MKKFLLSPLGEALKEAARLALFGGVSVFVTVLLERLVALPQSETTVILTFLLRMIDKYLHESGVAKKGLSRF